MRSLARRHATVVAHRVIQELEPLRAGHRVQERFASTPTTAPVEARSLDPAASDLVAAMTDQDVEDMMDPVARVLRQDADAEADDV